MAEIINLSKVKEIVLNAFSKAKDVFVLKNEYANSDNAGIIKISTYDFSVDEIDDEESGKSKGKLRLNSNNYYDANKVDSLVGSKLDTDTYNQNAITKSNIGSQNVNYAETSGKADSATTATSASTASKLSTNAGSETQPVYFANGVPTVCTAYSSASVNYANSSGAVSNTNNATITGTNNVFIKHGNSNSLLVQKASDTGGNHNGYVNAGTVSTTTSVITPKTYTQEIECTSGNLRIYTQNGAKMELQIQNPPSGAKSTFYAYRLESFEQGTPSSSRAVKNDITSMTMKEAKKILDLDFVSYYYKEGLGISPDILQYGLIAEDTDVVLPNIIMRKTEEELKNGQYNSVDYTKLIPYLGKMIQIQQEQIDNLQKEIDELKSK